MNRRKAIGASTLALLMLAGCATPPMGPTVAVMPAPGKPQDVFQGDLAYCKSVAQQSVAGEAEQANNKAVGTAAIGTVLGAGLGAAIGGGRGAAVGAGAGALGGTAVASNETARTQYTIQQQYDIAYEQCMYSRGNQVPGYYPAAPQAYPPPPSQGYPPPPPPPPPGYR